MCKKHPYYFGERVTLEFTGNANCGECAAPAQSWMTKIDCTYAGSNGDGCLFTFVTPQRCPSCGTIITGHLEYCGGDGDSNGLDWSVVEPVMRPQELKHYNDNIDGF